MKSDSLPDGVVLVERQPRKSGGPRIVYVMTCECGRPTRLRKYEYERGVRRQCHSCKSRKRPFESVFNSLAHDARGIEINLTYEDYLTFVGRPCFYCGCELPWTEYSTDRGEYKTRSYFLDRKDHRGPYSLDNCVACCTRCNRFRRDFYTFEEFCRFIPIIRAIDQDR